MRHLLRIADLGSADVQEILGFAREVVSGAEVPPRRPVVGLLFLAPSTRTRFGFAAATARLGGTPLAMSGVRATGEGLPPESLADTLRVISGMSDIVVCRPEGHISLDELRSVSACPLVNGGDSQEHPTQALMDLFAFETLAGPPSELHIGISGDLRSRTVRSLFQVLQVVPPRKLSLFAPPGRELDRDELPLILRDVARFNPEPNFGELDVLYLPGLAPDTGDKALASDDHLRWGFSPLSAPLLPDRAVVLSPGPVIDEIDPACADDPRVRVFEQSDLGIPVRMSVLQWLLGRADGP